VSSKLRVLPLGGLGEIGKNMTVVEQDGRIVVVDVGLRFPTPEMVGIDLVLPDFAYLRERARTSRRSSSRTATRTTSGRCRGFCASSADRLARPVYGGALTMAMARSKLDEHKLRNVELNEVEPGEDARASGRSRWSWST
jgi:ribonuclease J